MRAVDPVNTIGHAAPASLYFQFGKYDQWVPEDETQEFFDAASDPKQMTIYKTVHSLVAPSPEFDPQADRIAWLAELLGFDVPVE